MLKKGEFGDETRKITKHVNVNLKSQNM